MLTRRACVCTLKRDVQRKVHMSYVHTHWPHKCAQTMVHVGERDSQAAGHLANLRALLLATRLTPYCP